MSRRPYWAIECLDLEEAETLLEAAPEGSHIERVPRAEGAILIILWVPVPQDVVEAELGDVHQA